MPEEVEEEKKGKGMKIIIEYIEIHRFFLIFQTILFMMRPTSEKKKRNQPLRKKLSLRKRRNASESSMCGLGIKVKFRKVDEVRVHPKRRKSGSHRANGM